MFIFGPSVCMTPASAPLKTKQNEVLSLKNSARRCPQRLRAKEGVEHSKRVNENVRECPCSFRRSRVCDEH